MLRSYLSTHNHKTVHARSVFALIYRNCVHQLPHELQNRIAHDFSWVLPHLSKCIESEVDGTVKMQVELADRLTIETVLIFEKQRTTLCVSSQVGCAQRCVFCQTGRMGLKRQLDTHEVVAQYLLANAWLRNHNQQRTITNIVFMGMGEPLDNLNALIDAISILTDSYGLQFPVRKTSVSSVGNPRALRKLLHVYPNLNIAISIHSANLGLRTKLIPAQKKWPVHETLAILQQHGRSFLVQYTLLAGINDSLADAKELAAMLKGMDVKVNLIVYNPIRNANFSPTSIQNVKRFQNCLFEQKVRTMIRFSKGSDIDAACGQLFAV